MAEFGREAEFREFAESRADWLRKVAFLLCCDWHRADDLVQDTLTKLYVQWWRMRRVDNPDGYAKSQVIARLGALKPGSLLLIHGMADDNVIFENSTRVLYALQQKAIPFEMMTYPGLRHRTGWTSKPMIHRTRATLDFFDRKLKPAP